MEFLDHFLYISMRAEYFCTSTTAESRVKIWYQWNAFKSPGGLGCCPFLGGGTVVVVVVVVTPVVEFLNGVCFVVRYFMSILVLQSSSCGRECWLLCLVCLPDVS